MQNRDRRPEQTVTHPHTHDGPRTGQTNDDEWIMTCETCGVNFVEGMEDMEQQQVIEMMDILYGS
ncbi:hypothetical protein SEA_CROSBY_1 [Streptomyces phage Crosby]|nr:hypothetical protein SEA_CROSBY_1 [Streptomyces phage Crosby]